VIAQNGRHLLEMTGARSPYAGPSLAPALPGTTGSSLAPQHQQLLRAAAIDVDVALAAGVCSVLSSDQLPDPFRRMSAAVPALVFPWKGLDGTVVPQLRPDRPRLGLDGAPVKYQWPAGAAAPMNVHDWVRPQVLDPLLPLLVVEGTKQCLAAVTALHRDRDYAVVGMAGCYGWSQGGQLKPGFKVIPVRGRDIVLLLDADRQRNRNVYDAASKLAGQLLKAGASQVRYVDLGGQGTEGLDDVLAVLPEAARGGHLRALTSAASPDPGARPGKRYPRFFGPDGLLVRTLANDLTAAVPMLVGQDGLLYAYRDGYFQPGRDLVRAELCHRLGEQYRPAHAHSALEYLTAVLSSTGQVLPDHPSEPLLNVRNGMLNPVTEELVPHDPKYRSAVQLAVTWDPQAAAPVYERWLAEQAGDQAQDLEETMGRCWTPREGRPRHPSCSGQAVPGSRPCSGSPVGSSVRRTSVR